MNGTQVPFGKFDLITNILAKREIMSEILNDLFDSTVDDLKDMPVFKATVPGTYLAQFGWEREEDGDTPYVKFTWNLKELIDQADPKQEPEDLNKEGGKRVVINAFPRFKDKSTGEWKVNEFGEGLIKQIVKSLRDTFTGTNTGEILNEAQGCMVAVTFGIERRKDKDTKEVRENSKLMAMVVQE